MLLLLLLCLKKLDVENHKRPCNSTIAVGFRYNIQYGDRIYFSNIDVTHRDGLTTFRTDNNTIIIYLQ